MAGFIVSGKKLEEAEAKIRVLELKVAELGKENSMLREQIEGLKTENAGLKTQVDNVLLSVGKKDLDKAKDELMGKAKGAMGEYLKSITK